jgi:hypothetical protein
MLLYTLLICIMYMYIYYRVFIYSWDNYDKIIIDLKLGGCSKQNIFFGIIKSHPRYSYSIADYFYCDLNSIVKGSINSATL